MNICQPFVMRPVGTTLLAIALALAGLAGFVGLPVAPLPRVDFPTIQISAGLPGASPETMASAVATPLERRFGRIAGLSEMSSTSALGQVSIVLQFSLDKNIDAAARDVQAAINAASADLPANLPLRPSFRKVNPADAPMMVLALTSKSLSTGRIYDEASNTLAQRISQVEGVGEVMVGGGGQTAVRVQVDPRILAAKGLTLETIRTALGQNSVQLPKGSLQNGRRTLLLSAPTRVDAASYRDLIVGYVQGAPLRLGDIGRVYDSVENNKLAAWFDTDRAILMMLRREPGANIMRTVDQVKALLPELMASVPGAIDVHVAMDQSRNIRASVLEIERTLVFTVVLVVLVVFLFLQSVRATSIPSVVVPLSLLASFAPMYVLGYSLDNLSLMALTICTGFVVDDAIVVAENITRHIERGVRGTQAALLGTQEIAFTVVSITLSLLAVFLPLLLMQGLVGRLFREFAVTLGIAVALSGIISLTLTPMMCARLLAHDRAQSGKPAWLRPIERGLAAIQASYARGVGWALNHQTIMLMLTVAMVALNVALFVDAPKGLIPQQDNGMLIATVEGPQDGSFASLSRAQRAVQRTILADPAIAHAVSFISGTTGGAMFISLLPPDQRQARADAIIARLRPQLAKLAGIKVFLQAAQDIRVGGRSARTQFQYSLQAADSALLDTWAPKMVAALRTHPELKDVASDQQSGGLRLMATLAREQAAAFGITSQSIDNVLYDAFGQRQVATLYLPTRPAHVILEVPPSLQQEPSALFSLYVGGNGNAVVPMAELVRVEREGMPLSVNHQGQYPSVTLSFNLAPTAALGDAVVAVDAAAREVGLPSAIQASFQGTAQAFGDTLRSMPLLIGMALLAVYIILGVLYESFVHPLTILSTLPSAGVGALLMLRLCGQPFDLMGLIGIILLIGIVKKNAIMMVDFAIAAQRGGQRSPREAIFQACVERFRPITMTTLAALLGAVPLAVGTGVGAELRRPLGLAIVGGLAVSQLLTLFTAPVVYLAFERLAAAWRRR